VRRRGWLLLVGCLAAIACGTSGGNRGGGATGTGGTGGLPAPSLLTVIADRFPAPDAPGVCADTPLRLTFTVPVAVGTAGKIQVWKASAPDAPVDSVDVGATAFQDTIGNRRFNQNRPVFIDGMTAIVYLHRSAPLAANETYFVTVEPGVFVDGGGASLGAISTPGDWRFTTRAPSPASTGTLVVAGDNSGDFCSVQSAFDHVPAGNTTPVTIQIKNGTYREILFLSVKNNITIRGEDRKQTILAYANNNTLQAPNAAAYRSLFSAESVKDIVIENLTIHNLTPQGGSQAEALRIEPGDRVVVRNADILSLQDTLLLSGRVYLTDCYIEGNVDYVWGSGTAFFERCEIKTVGRKGYTVQSRNLPSRYGYVFVDSKLTADPGLTGHVLARIDAGVYPASHVAYVGCTMGSHVAPEGWLLTNAADTSQIRFWEYGSVDPTGAPIDVSLRHAASKQLTEAEAAVMRDPAMVFATPAPGWDPTP
jgi:pectin methylesterase-like acyl-CoA thioesterase